MRQAIWTPPFLVLFSLGYGLGFLVLTRLPALYPAATSLDLWSPAAGLRFAALLRYGPRVAVPVLLTEIGSWALIGVLDAGPAFASAGGALAAALPPLIYTLALWALVHRRGIAISLDRFTNLLWIGAAAIAGSALSAAATSTLAPGGAIPAIIALDAWVCELLGVLSAGPVLYGVLLLLDGRQEPHWNWPLVLEAIAALSLGALLVTFVGATSSFIHWYPALLPVLWLAVRHGWVGAATAALAVTVATIAGAASAATPAARLEIQLFLLLQSGIGLLLGGLATSRARMATNLKVRETALAHLERLSLLGQMAASLAHEIAQPLSAISAFAKAGSEPNADDERRAEALRLIGHEAERLKAIIQRTRALSQNKPPRPGSMDLCAAISDLEPLLLLEASRCAATLRLETPREVPPVHADEVQIQQVLLNLVRNAVEAVKDEPSDRRLVVVRVSVPRGDMIRISVIDRGRGAGDEELAAMFKPFVGRTASGVGLGLAISRTIVEAHGGRLWAERPRREQGLSLCFTLPRFESGGAR